MTFSVGRFFPVCLVIVGCQGGAAPRARRIVAHRLLDCEPENHEVVLTALGDFPAPRVKRADLKSTDEIDLPLDLRGIEASTWPPGFSGVGYAEPPGDVDFTMWSTTSACRAVEGEVVPPSQGGQAMTAFDDGGGVLIAGLDPLPGGAVSDAAFALVWDARTGAKLSPSSLGTHRVSWATATPFGKGALVAGGLDRKFFPLRYLDSALIFRDGAFQELPISIGDARAQHGAVVLASGATLLVGGEDERGVVDTLVSIAPTDTAPYGAADFFRLGSLTRARKLPTVLRLSNDEILVAGGVDGDGNYVPTLEWFAKDGGHCPHAACSSDPPALAGLTEVAFVALAGGGVLAVGGLLGRAGALASGVFWIDNDGTLEKLPSLTSEQRGTKRLRLVAAADGAPWLWNGEAWHRFDPWQSAFVTPDGAPDDGPEDDLPSPLAVDTGLFVWLSRGGIEEGTRRATLRGFRHGVRGPYTQDPDFLLADPRHLAPSHPPRPEGELWTDLAGLHLSPSAGVVITDATYGNVVISGETPGSSLPTVALGEWTIGDASAPCPWSFLGTSFTVTRSGRTVLVKVDDRAPTSCAGPEGRVSIGLRGLGPETVTVKRLAVERR
ncbi:MAG TPA: hypothetical protein VK550_06225 [Polyangiaceae bacterium]|nr:hypothetical protein [Polyangiaceae bacterium]